MRQSLKIKFAKSVVKALQAAGGTIVDDNTMNVNLILNTIYGELKINVPKTKSAICTIYARFVDVDLAKTGLEHRNNFNPYSGKFNIHEYQDHLALNAMQRDIISLAK